SHGWDAGEDHDDDGHQPQHAAHELGEHATELLVALGLATRGGDGHHPERHDHERASCRVLHVSLSLMSMCARQWASLSREQAARYMGGRPATITMMAITIARTPPA